MKLFGLEITKAKRQDLSSVTSNSVVAGFSHRRRPLQLATAYRCVEVLSDSLASLPLKIYEIDDKGFKREAKEHPAFWLLDNEPNGDMTRFTFFKTIMASVIMRGNGYAYIERDDQMRIQELVYIPAEDVRIGYQIDDAGIKRKRYIVNGIPGAIMPGDMLHFLNYSDNGIVGISTLEHAFQTLDLAASAADSANGFFKGGGAASGILTVEGVPLTEEQKEDIHRKWLSHQDKSAGGIPSGIQILEGNMKYQPISFSPRDMAMLDIMEFETIELCRYFGCSPIKVFDFSKSSYSTVEATQLQFLTDTLQPIITKFEQELNRKIFLPSERGRFVCEFDTTTLLRADKTSQSNWFTNLFHTGAITPNEIRKSANLPRIEGGDAPFIAVNLQPLEKSIAPDPAM